MTPRNPLDKKVIVDREDLHTAVCYVRQAAFQHEQKGYGTHHALLDLIARLEEQALATNLTGWAAVPVEHTPDMASAAVKALENSICADIDFHLSWVNTADQEVQLVSCLGRTHCAMLNASPALFETREKENEQA
jgi:hypothetical protein